MDTFDYLRVLRRRWLVVAAAGLVALVVGLVALPPAADSDHAAPQGADQYRATTRLLQTSPGAPSVPLRVLPSLATAPEIAATAAKAIGDNPTAVGARVSVSVDDQLRTVDVTATDRDPERATATAGAFSDALLDFLQKRARGEIDRKIALFEDLLSHNRAERAAVSGTGATAKSQRKALTDANVAVRKQITTLQVTRATAGSDLEVLQHATAVPDGGPAIGPISDVSGNRWLRLSLVVATGLLLGAGLALAIERFDTRLRGRTAVEDALRLPVVSSIPAIRRRHRGRYEALTTTQPQSGIAEAYRSLRSALALLPSFPVPAAPGIGAADEAFSAVRDPRVLLFVSPRGGDGKTTSLVNLASAIAESGRSVIVLDCDFRHPEAHRFLDVTRGGGLSDLLSADSDRKLATVLQPTSVPAVRLARAGTSYPPPGALMGWMRHYVVEARAQADIVLIDAPPPMLANDAIDLMPLADTVVVVVRDGRTHKAEATQLSALLARLRVPCLGVVLVAARDASAAYFLRDAPRRRPAKAQSTNRKQATRGHAGRHGRAGK